MFHNPPPRPGPLLLEHTLYLLHLSQNLSIAQILSHSRLHETLSLVLKGEAGVSVTKVEWSWWLAEGVEQLKQGTGAACRSPFVRVMEGKGWIFSLLELSIWGVREREQEVSVMSTLMQWASKTRPQWQREQEAGPLRHSKEPRNEQRHTKWPSATVST